MRLFFITLLISAGLISSSFGQDSPSKRSSPQRARRAIEQTRLSDGAGFFPLAVGNSWVYDVTGFAGGRPTRSYVDETRQIGGQTYHRLNGQANGLGWVRMADDGRLLQIDPETSVESLIYNFGGAVGTEWIPEGPAFCNGRARIAERDEQRLVVEYLAAVCTDAGVTHEIFEAGVELVSRRESTIGGERRHDLREAFIEDEWIDRRGLVSSLSTDKPAYSEDETMRVRLAVSNSTSDAITLRFPSGQRFDFAITDSDGLQIYTWSANKLFTQETGEIEIESGERVFIAEIAPFEFTKEQARPGSYSLSGWLTTTGTRSFGASVGFEIAAAEE